MTIKEFFADFSDDYADVFIMDSADMCDAYRGTIYPYNGEISIDFADKTPNPAISYADREIDSWFIAYGVFHITLKEEGN